MARTLKQQLTFLLALLAALFFSILLFPVLLLMILLFVIYTSWRLYRKQSQPKQPLPKGTIEILPKEEVDEPVSTKNQDLEITIDILQRRAKNEPSDGKSFRDSQKDS